MPPPTIPLSGELDNIGDTRDIEGLIAPYAPLANRNIHCVLVNLPDRNFVMQDGGFVTALAHGLKNILVHGNSCLRKYASGLLANLQRLD